MKRERVFAVVLATHQNFIWYALVPIRSPFLIVETGEAAGTSLAYDFELYGLWFAESLRENLLAASTMRHDCFPSGHTMMTITSLLITWRWCRRAFWWLLVPCLLLIASTVLLRYHWATDVVVGALLAWPCARLCDRLMDGDGWPAAQASRK